DGTRVGDPRPTHTRTPSLERPESRDRSGALHRRMLPRLTSSPNGRVSPGAEPSEARNVPRERDLAIVVLSTNEAQWLERCLSTAFAHAGGASLDVIVVDNASTDGTREFVESNFPEVRVVSSPNRGFAYGNNRGLEHANARYLLVL